jgi:hypothetical protein
LDGEETPRDFAELCNGGEGLGMGEATMLVVASWAGTIIRTRLDRDKRLTVNLFFEDSRCIVFSLFEKIKD